MIGDRKKNFLNALLLVALFAAVFAASWIYLKPKDAAARDEAVDAGVLPGQAIVGLHLGREVAGRHREIPAVQDFLDEPGVDGLVIRNRRRGGSDGHRYEILTPPLPGQRAEVSRHTLAPGASTGGPGDPPMHEPGSRETAVIEAGTVTLLIDDARHELRAGDTVTFDADLPHHFENHGKEEAALLAVVSAGLRRS